MLHPPIKIGDRVTTTDGDSYSIKDILHDGNSLIVRVFESPYIVIKLWKVDHHQREIEILKLCSSDYVVKLEAELTNRAGYVMKYYKSDLRRWHKRGFVQSTFLSLLSIVTQICEALEHIHQRGFAHLDVKPENILVDPANDRVLLADFSSAQPIAAFKPEHMEVTLLPDGQYLGKVTPIQLDTYTIGALMYELMEGPLPRENNRPFGGRAPTDEQIRRLPFTTVPDALAQIVRLCLQFQFDSAQRLGQAIAQQIKDADRIGDPANVRPRFSVVARLRGFGRDVRPLFPAGARFVWATIIGVSTWNLTRQFPGVEANLWFSVFLPCVASLLALTLHLGVGAFAALLAQSAIIAQYRPGVGASLALLALGSALGSLASKSSWHLLLLAMLPAIDWLIPLIALLPLALLIKPESSMRARWPIVTFTVLPWAMLLTAAGSCGDIPELCRDIHSFGAAQVLSAPWWTQILPLTHLSTDLLTILRTNIQVYPASILLFWAALESYTQVLLGRFNLLEGTFQPLARFVSACLLLLSCLAIATMFAAITGDAPVLAFLTEFWQSHMPTKPLVTAFVFFFIAFLYDPSDGDMGLSPFPLLLVPLAVLLIFLALPLLDGLIQLSIELNLER